MKIKVLLLLSIFFVNFAEAQSNHHGDNHVKHNMVLFGRNQLYVSHIVYISPHNYQVILEVSLSKKIRERYFKSKQQYPTDLFIFLLDPIDISKINSEKIDLYGTMLRENKDGQRVEIATSIKIPREKYQIIFFDELPLFLGK